MNIKSKCYEHNNNMNRHRTYHFCNNCGKQGHVFNACKLPIISLGIVAFRLTKEGVQYLLICRKDSLGFIEFLRGKYPLYNKEYILNLIDEMTMREKEMLLKTDFKTLWKHLWGEFIGVQYRNEERHANDKFTQIKRGIQMYDEGNYDLESLIKDSKTSWETPEWGFPKGRRNYQESDVKCAFREFNEETGYDKEMMDLVTNVSPFEEIFMGSNFKTYKHKYYIAKYNGPDTTTNYQKSEVSDMKWLTYEEAARLIRPYNIEKLKMFSDINKTLEQYRLIS